MDDSPTNGFRHHPTWLLGAVGLLLAQAGLTLALFGADRAWATLADDRPVTSGRHPLRLYHGSLGSAAFRDRGATTCYDPAFQAGYPKTPVFDGGCRPAELFLVMAGGGYHPAAYKVGLFVCVLLVPLAFVVAARGAGLPAGAAVLAGAAGMLLGWSGPVRHLIEEGDLDFFLAGLAAIVFVAWLARYAKWFGIDSWLVLAGVAVAGWYAHPLVWIGLLPLVVGYYLVLAPRHGPAWHLGLLGITAAGLAPNLWWLTDWGRYWWLRQPSPSDHIPLPDWDAVLGSPGDYATLFGCVPGGVLLVLAGAVGLVAVWRAGHRTAACLVFAAAVLTVGLARLAAAWPRVPADVPLRVMPLAAGFLAIPAAFGVWKLLDRARVAGLAAVGVVLGFLLVGWVDGPSRPLATAARLHTDPLVVGLGTDQRELIEAVVAHTNTEARILWDETTDHRPGWNWTALLPRLTGRMFLGGLDHDAGIEHAFCGLRDGRLNGRPLGEWTDVDLTTFCHWYNVGWVVCRSAGAAERWGRFPVAKPVARLKEGGQPVVVYVLDRPRSFVLSGSAKWEEASVKRVALSDVVPDARGVVELSLHYQEGMPVYPSYVTRNDRDDTLQDPTGRDPIDHVRLRLPGPVPRITIVFEHP